MNANVRIQGTPPRQSEAPHRLLLVLAVAALGGCNLSQRHPDSTLETEPVEAVVQLRCASIPRIHDIAIHCYFATWAPKEGRWHRWEVWQHAGHGSHAWGHLRKDRAGPRSGVGHGSSWPLYEWRGDTAQRLLAVIDEPEDYPWRHEYEYWPGPNSNTYPAWVLRAARVPGDLHPMAIGKDYCGPMGFGVALSSTRTGLQIETPLAGVKIGLADGVELHLLGGTFGIDLWAPAIKTIFGRVGSPETLDQS